LILAAGAFALAASIPAKADHIFIHTPVSVGECLLAALGLVGGHATHMEFESRGGQPIYEFVVFSDNVNYYVACNATNGAIQDVDILVEPGDERFAARSRYDEAAARAAVLAQYPGEIEEVKWFLMHSGHVWYEVDVEIVGTDGEFNVWIDAETGGIVRVDVEYWEIGAHEGLSTDPAGS
jgi:uncharacterized membrane protein YkoI